MADNDAMTNKTNPAGRALLGYMASTNTHTTCAGCADMDPENPAPAVHRMHFYYTGDSTRYGGNYCNTCAADLDHWLETGELSRVIYGGRA